MSDQGNLLDETQAAPTGQPSSTDEAANKRRETKKARIEREDREFFKLVAASEVGRRFLWSILDRCKTFETQFSFGPVGFPDPHETFFRLGMREVGQALYQTWHHRDPEHAMKMLFENDKRFAVLEA